IREQCSDALARRLCGRAMVVDVPLFAVLPLFLVLAVVVAVGECVVVVLVGVPVGAVLPLAERPAAMVVRYVIVIVGMRDRRVRMSPGAALALGPLRGRRGHAARGRHGNRIAGPWRGPSAKWQGLIST